MVTDWVPVRPGYPGCKLSIEPLAQGYIRPIYIALISLETAAVATNLVNKPSNPVKRHYVGLMQLIVSTQQMAITIHKTLILR